jgi:hypothetical protein
MSIHIQDTFEVNIGLPIDSRIVATTSAVRDAITYKYDGLSVFQLSDRKTYTWNATTATWSGTADFVGAGNVGYLARFSDVRGLTSSALYMTTGSTPLKGKIGINTPNPQEIFQINVDTGSADPFVVSQATNTILALNWYNDGTDKSFSNANPSAAIKFRRTDGAIHFLSRAASTSALDSSDTFNVNNVLARFSLGSINFTRDLNFNNANSGSSAAYIRATGSVVSSFSTKSLPDYTWNSDGSTGLYHPASARIGFAIGGQQKMVLNASGLLISSDDTAVTTPSSRLHLHNSTAAQTYLQISNVNTGSGANDSMLVGISQEGWPQIQSRWDNKPFLIRFSNGNTGGGNFFRFERNYFTIFSNELGSGFSEMTSNAYDRVMYGTRNFNWFSEASQAFRTVFQLTLPSSSSVIIECQFNTSINASGNKQFRNQKSIYAFTVNLSGAIQQLPGSPDLISESASSSISFIGQSQVVSAGANTLAFQVNLGNGANGWSGRSVVSFTSTVNRYQGH